MDSQGNGAAGGALPSHLLRPHPPTCERERGPPGVRRGVCREFDDSQRHDDDKQPRTALASLIGADAVDR